MSGFELLSDQGLRLDGRKAGELRRIQTRYSVCFVCVCEGEREIELGSLAKFKQGRLLAFHMQFESAIRNGSYI